MDQLLEIYRGQRDPDQISSQIIGRVIMRYTGIWLDKNDYQNRKWTWTLAHLAGFFVLSFILVTFSWGLPNNMGTLGEFSGWMNVTMGVMLAFVKALFLIGYREEISDMLAQFASLDVINQRKGEEDQEIRKLRKSYFVTEITLPLSGIVIVAIMGVLVFGPGLFYTDKLLPPPAATPLDFDGTPIGFWLSYVFVSLGGVWAGFVMVSSDFLVGNLYNQVILNFCILVREIQRAGQDSRAPSEKEKWDEDNRKQKEVIRIIQDYQRLRQLLHTLNMRCNKLLLVVVTSNMFLVTIISIELAFVIHGDLVNAIRPVHFFFLMNVPFFYWCWLGQRMIDLSDDIPFAVYGFDWNCGDIQFRKLRLMMMQMTGQPLRIEAYPFFTFDHSLFMTVLRRAYSIMAVLKDVASTNK